MDKLALEKVFHVLMLKWQLKFGDDHFGFHVVQSWLLEITDPVVMKWFMCVWTFYLKYLNIKK